MEQEADLRLEIVVDEKRTGRMYILNVHIHSAILFRHMVCVLDRLDCDA